MYSLCGNIRSDYSLKVRDVRVRLISCLPNSNRNSAREFIRVSYTLLADELPCPTSPRDVGRYLVLVICFKFDVFPILISLTHILTGFHVVLVHKVKDLNRTLESCT